MQPFLYRGISVNDDRKNNGEILLKGERPDIEGQAGNIWMQCGAGIECGSSDGNAVVAHQFDSEISNTSYVSTTKEFEVAVQFATQDNSIYGYVYTLNTEKFSEYGVMAYEREGPSVYNEEEVTIRTKDLGPIPSEVLSVSSL